MFDDPAVPLVDGLHVVDAGVEPRAATRPSPLRACAHRFAAIAGAVDGHARLRRSLPRLPLNTRSSSGGRRLGCGAASVLQAARTRRRIATIAPAPHAGILAERISQPRAIVDRVSVMDVYLVPVGADRHELYCEVPDEPDDQTPTRADAGSRRASSAACGCASARCWPKPSASAVRPRTRRARRTGGSRASRRARCAGWPRASPSSACSGTCAARRDACLFYPDDIDEAQRDGGPAHRSSDATTSSIASGWSIDALVFVVSGAAHARARPELHRLLLRVPAGRPLPLDARRAAGLDRRRLDSARRARR